MKFTLFIIGIFPNQIGIRILMHLFLPANAPAGSFAKNVCKTFSLRSALFEFFTVASVTLRKLALLSTKNRNPKFSDFLFGLGIFIIGITSSYSQSTTLINKRKIAWPKAFQVVDIRSPLDNEIQKAYFYVSKSKEPQPLIISLHTWSNNYTQQDPLTSQILKNDWNYIHPDFRGVNKTPKALGSKYAINDIEEAITFALKNSNVDLNNIHVIGKSGGGLATLLAYMNSKHDIASFSSWVPISDLQAWYYQSLGRKNKYAGHILAATSKGDSILNITEARKRSPMFMVTPKEKNFMTIGFSTPCFPIYKKQRL